MGHSHEKNRLRDCELDEHGHSKDNSGHLFCHHSAGRSEKHYKGPQWMRRWFHSGKGLKL